MKQAGTSSAAGTFSHRPLAFRMLMDGVFRLAHALSVGTASFELAVRLLAAAMAIGSGVLLWRGLLKYARTTARPARHRRRRRDPAHLTDQRRRAGLDGDRAGHRRHRPGPDGPASALAVGPARRGVLRRRGRDEGHHPAHSATRARGRSAAGSPATAPSADRNGGCGFPLRAHHRGLGAVGGAVAARHPYRAEGRLGCAAGRHTLPRRLGGPPTSSCAGARDAGARRAAGTAPDGAGPGPECGHGGRSGAVLRLSQRPDGGRSPRSRCSAASGIGCRRQSASG